MRTRFLWVAGAAVVLAGFGLTASVRADEYVIDGMHSGVNFKIGHIGLSWVYGRFDKFSGGFTLDANDPSKASFRLTIEAASVDTNNEKRDGHLKSPDFFNAKQFPTINFQSTAVKAVKDGYQVTGDLTMHGVTKPVTFVLVGGKQAEFPK